MRVLIITERNDIHGHALIWALAKLGVRCDRWTISEFPEHQRTSVRIPNSSAPPSFKIAGLPFEEYDSIWARRLSRPKSISPRLAAADVEMALLQARRCSDGILSIFSPNAVWINPLEARRNANRKPEQLIIARHVGFSIPETLLSNDVEEIRLFYREHGGNVICKFYTPAFWKDAGSGSLSCAFTARLTEAEMNSNDEAFTSCPGIYQRCAEKKADLRVTFFGSSYTGVRIWSQQSQSGKVDVRSDMIFESRLEPLEVEGHLLERCQAMSSALGLLHGSYDFVEHPDGSITFLEINEMGQFLWLEERAPRLPMLSMFAAFSLDPRPDFQFDAGRRPVLSFHDFIRSEAYAPAREDLLRGEAHFQYLE
jgi:hypothetical protein